MSAGDALLDFAESSAPKRRSFIAGSAKPAELPVAPAEGDDLPILTEVVDPATVVSEPLATIDAEPPPIAPERIEALARELLFEGLPAQRQALADELGAWLDRELPRIVMRVLDGLTDQLVGQVTEESRATLLPSLQAALENEPGATGDD